MDRSKALAALAALSHGDRLDLVRLLVRAGEDGLAAGEIARQLGLSASRLSFHLSALEQGGLIASRRAARNVIYTIDTGGLGRTIAYLLNDCCMDHPEVVACCQHGRVIETPSLRPASGGQAGGKAGAAPDLTAPARES
ncbi:ArsR/SmtB family transcription factor [Xinfangfangia pollutisoli]|uniref:ArsR/SmtB family transcription factor n=1 Tax=Xinfangfangia pollutisoli TaxID=2865960 RepID=UPI001CD37AE9|nr:metalloregulator ArsR/SmtB family transcription factor [Xinfangfangia pollutisoli]